MAKIFEPDDNFVFSNVSLISPVVVSGGSYFIKYSVNEHPFYVQAPKCITKQGFIKAGKKIFCDLIFNNENEKFIKWMEDLENHTQQQIFNNRAHWFESELEMHDIENFFTSPLKLFKGGKYYIVRVNIPTRLGKCSLKVFDEDEKNVDPETIKENTNVVSILEIQGVKCSAKSFQIDMEIKQMMVLKPNKLFETCVIDFGGKKNKEPSPPPPQSSPPQSSPPQSPHSENTSSIQAWKNEDIVSMDDPFSGLEEIDINVENLIEKEEINIKNRNDVYHKIYKDAKKKAKITRNLALSAYLEVKRIKNLYMLNDIDDSDGDDDDDDDDNNDGVNKTKEEEEEEKKNKDDEMLMFKEQAKKNLSII